MLTTIIVMIWSAILSYLAYPRIKEIIGGRKTKATVVTDDSDHYVQLDCKKCGKINRVFRKNLLDKPKCGACKERLLPGKRIVTCHVKNVPFDETLGAEIEIVRDDYVQFGHALDRYYNRRHDRMVN